jgi:Ferritin-like domain
MGVRRSTAVSDRRRGGSRAVFVFVAALVFVAAGCGKSGHGAATDSEKAGDVEVLNESLARELTAVDVYTRGLDLLRGRGLALARQLRAQDQAYIDALTKAIRGLGGETDAEAEALEDPPPRDATEALTAAYEAENAALAGSLAAAPRLQTAAPRTLAAALSGGHAQHLTLLRQALGAGLLESAPEPFESGDMPPPRSDERAAQAGAGGAPRSPRPGEAR